MCEIELPHMGKNNGNPDLVCENKVIYMDKRGPETKFYDNNTDMTRPS